MNAPEAISIRCRRCGGTFGFIPYPGNARCPYCALEQPVSAELIAELQRYAGNVGRELARADAAYQRAAAWQQWSGQADHAIPRLKIVIPVVSGSVLLVSVGIPVSQALGISAQQISVLAAPLLVILPCFLMGYIVWLYAGGQSAAKRAVAGNIAVACPNCGARGDLVPGNSAQSCAYCGTALIASRHVMQRGVDAAELAHRHARLEEFRQERLGMAGLARYDMTPYLPFIVSGSLLMPVGGGAIAFTVAMLNGDEPYHPAIFGIWALTLGIILFLCLVVLRRRYRRRAYAAVLSDLGRQFPIRRLAGARELADWLNRHWPAKYDSVALYCGIFFVGASMDAHGYPALLNADFTGQPRKPRVHLLLAAHQRWGHVVAGEAAQRVQQAFARCRSLGFEVTPSEAGLLAVADEETLRILRKSPSALHELAPVLSALAGAAYAAGAVPAESAI